MLDTNFSATLIRIIKKGLNSKGHISSKEQKVFNRLLYLLKYGHLDYAQGLTKQERASVKMKLQYYIPASGGSSIEEYRAFISLIKALE